MCTLVSSLSKTFLIPNTPGGSRLAISLATYIVCISAKRIMCIEKRCGNLKNDVMNIEICAMFLFLKGYLIMVV